MKKEKYRVTGDFGLREVGDILDCFVLAVDGNIGLIYIPANKKLGECDNIELCKRDRRDLFWVSRGKDNWMNIIGEEKESREFLKFLKKLDKRRK